MSRLGAALAWMLATAPAAQAANALDMAGDRPLVRIALSVREALGMTFAALSDFPARAYDTLAYHSGESSIAWIWMAVFVLAGALAAGTMALRATEDWLSMRLQAARLPADGGDRATRIGVLIARGVIMTLALLPFCAAALAVSFIFVSGHPATRLTVVLALQGALGVLALRILLRAILAPNLDAGRMLPLSGTEAQQIYRALMGTGIVGIALLTVCDWMQALGLDEAAHRLALIVSVSVVCGLLSAATITNRAAIGRLIGGTETAGRPRRLLARFWLPLTLFYYITAFVVSAVRILLGQEAALGLVAAPVTALMVWAAVLGLQVLVIDRLLLPRLDSESRLARRAEDLARAETAAGEAPDPEATRAQAAAEAMEAEARRLPYRQLLDHGASILAVVVAVGFALLRWGVDISSDNSVVGNLFEICVIVFMAYMAYRAVELAIDRQMQRESSSRPGQGLREDPESGGGVRESRLATLLPIFRNFLLIAIVAVGGMIVLSELGVNIGPLFAGAGVVGLAVGFGAQTLIRDIFSGAFFLIDDAFRKGEYIDIGSVKGTVEKISIRSMQLRHHNGPLNTVPFGEIKFVKNFSRDWAVMKLAFRVTYDADVEKMRKLIKKFGQDLMQHPEYGPKFLQPVKSQGVTALEDSAMIVRVKFMTRPGDQFELRKVVYSGIRDLCEANDIHFAHREVTVRVAQDPADPRQFSEAEKKAIGAAVLPTVAAQQPSTAMDTDAR